MIKRIWRRIRQRDRVEELERAVQERLDFEECVESNVQACLAENAKLREALEFYADRESWEADIGRLSKAVKDLGDIARRVLGKKDDR